MGKRCMPFFIAQSDLANRLQLACFSIRFINVDNAVIKEISGSKTNGSGPIEVDTMRLFCITRYGDGIYATYKLVCFTVDDTYPV